MLERVVTYLSYLAIVALACASGGCNTGDVSLGGWGSTSGDPDDGDPDDADPDDGDPDLGRADETGGGEGEEGGEGGGEGGGVPCGYQGMFEEFEIVELPVRDGPDHFVFEPAEDGDCDFDGIFAEEDAGPFELEPGPAGAFDVWVYHPQDIGSQNPDLWPNDLAERPAVFFAPGNGYFTVGDGTSAEDGSQPEHHHYRDVIRTLVEELGFVVFAIDPAGGSMSSGPRRAALACTMIWARDEWDPGDRLATYMQIMGHSRGGGGGYLLTEHLLSGTSLPEATSLDDWRQCALTTFAQRYGEAGETVITPITHHDAPPFLSILGATDEDTVNQGIAAYDNRHAESPSGPVELWDELALVVHGRSHVAWGGNAAGGSLIGSFYASHFARWQFMGEDASRRRFMDLVDNDVDTCAFDYDVGSASQEPPYLDADGDPPFFDADEWDGVLDPYYDSVAL